MTVNNPMYVTPEDLFTYQKDGVVLIKNVLNEFQIEAGRKAIEAAIANPGPQAEFISADPSTWEGLKDSFGDSSSSSSRTWTMFQDQFSSERCPEMKTFIQSSPAAQVAATLMQSSTATFFYDHVICKRPTASRTSNSIPWHQDIPYWSVKGTFASVWIPLDEMPLECAVQWILGSHKLLFQPRHFVDSSPYQGTEDMEKMPDIDAMIASGEASVKTFHVRPGDALVFDARIVHGSPGNSTSTSAEGTGLASSPHRRMALRFGGDDAVYWRYDNRETAIPTPDLIHGLSHGDKLACDVFPLMWPPTTPDDNKT